MKIVDILNENACRIEKFMETHKIPKADRFEWRTKQGWESDIANPRRVKEDAVGVKTVSSRLPALTAYHLSQTEPDSIKNMLRALKEAKRLEKEEDKDDQHSVVLY